MEFVRHVGHLPRIVWCMLGGGVRGGAVGWGTALQAVRSRVWFRMLLLELFIDIIPPSRRSVALGLTQPLTEMSTRNISWGVKAAGA
jgi:chloramphenicol 3-O-phosphotransferase